MFKKLWKRTKETATLYTGTFVVVMILNQLLFFGFCLNPICLIAAMPHVLLITVAIGTWLNKINGWGTNEIAQNTIKATSKSISKAASKTQEALRETEHLLQEELTKSRKEKKFYEIQEFLDSEISKENNPNDQTNKKHELEKSSLRDRKNFHTNDSEFFKPNLEKFGLSSEYNSSKRKPTNDSEFFKPDLEKFGLSSEYNSSKRKPTNDSEFFKPDLEKFGLSSSLLELEPPQWLLNVPPLTEEEAEPHFCNQKSDVKYFIEKLNSYGIFSIWHITHKNNINGILEKGILSNRIAYESVKPLDISNRVVQAYREGIEPIYNRKIHEYTPTYINPKNPMLFSKKDIQNDLCLIEISLSALRQSNFLFTDGNAASKETKFYSNINNLDSLPWDVLKAKYWTDFENGKRLRCSEFLIYPLIEPDNIYRIHCNNQEVLNYLERLNCPANLTKELFFETNAEYQAPLNSDPF